MREFEVEGVVYKICGPGLALLLTIKNSHHHFIVPSEAFSPDGSKYQIIGISNFFELNGKIDIISFDSATSISDLSASFVFSSREHFILPSTVTRVYIPQFFRYESIKNVTVEGENRFVSVTGKRNIRNHHPFEILLHEFHRTRLFIKETIKIIGMMAFYRNNMIKSVSIPPSVEVIGKSSFAYCYNLSKVAFNGNSNLRKIEDGAFYETSIQNISFPSSLQEIGGYSFYKCRNLRTISFAEESKLEVIGTFAFKKAIIESIEFPSSLEKIGDFAFNRCYKLKSVSFLDKSKSVEMFHMSFVNCRLLNKTK